MLWVVVVEVGGLFAGDVVVIVAAAAAVGVCEGV